MYFTNFLQVISHKSRNMTKHDETWQNITKHHETSRNMTKYMTKHDETWRNTSHAYHDMSPSYITQITNFLLSLGDGRSEIICSPSHPFLSTSRIQKSPDPVFWNNLISVVVTKYITKRDISWCIYEVVLECVLHVLKHLWMREVWWSCVCACMWCVHACTCVCKYACMHMQACLCKCMSRICYWCIRL